jgi:hypothetical protein
MTTRTVLLTLHIAAVAAWFGADVLQHVVSSRLERGGQAVATAWARAQLLLHERYYPVVAAIVLGTGIWLVIEVGWSWSSGFIWVGVGAIVGGATLGGGGLGSLTKQRITALEAGDAVVAATTARRARLLSLVVTLLPLLAIVAMVDRWRGK